MNRAADRGVPWVGRHDRMHARVPGGVESNLRRRALRRCGGEPALTPREEAIIKMRFGVGDGSEHTLEEVGQTFAVTRERIRQIEAKALRKLRHPSRSRTLRAFLDGRTT